MVFGRYINVNSGKAKKGEEILTFYQKRFKVQGSRCWLRGEK